MLALPQCPPHHVHLPRLTAARDQALVLQAACEAAGPVPAPQQAAITGYISDLAQLIGQINDMPTSHEGDTL